MRNNVQDTLVLPPFMLDDCLACQCPLQSTPYPGKLSHCSHLDGKEHRGKSRDAELTVIARPPCYARSSLVLEHDTRKRDLISAT